MRTQQPTNDALNMGHLTPLEDSPSAGCDAGYVEELELRAAAAATYAALSVATQHWADHGGDLATHIRVALRGLQTL